MKNKISYLTISTPDYFQGHKKTVLQVSVWKGMTKDELTEAILLEYGFSYDYLVNNNPENSWPELSTEELRSMCDTFIVTDSPFEKSDIPTLEEYQNGEDLETTYLYVICEEKDE